MCSSDLPEYFKQLAGKYSQAPPWKAKNSSINVIGQHMNKSEKPLVRAPHLGPFTTDELQKAMAVEATKLNCQIDEKFPDATSRGMSRFDRDLAKPWEEAEERAKGLMEETGSEIWIDALAAIEAHVEEMKKAWSNAHLRTRERTETKAFTDAPIEHRQDALRAVSRAFWNDFAAPYEDAYSVQEWRRLVASCAYKKYFKSLRFPFDVAFRELCAIKAETVSAATAKSMLPGFYEGMTMSRRFVKMDEKACQGKGKMRVG